MAEPNNSPKRKKNGIDPEEEKKRREQYQRQMRFSVIYMLIALVFLWVFQEFVLSSMVIKATELTYSEFRQKVADKTILTATISDTEVVGTMKNPDASGPAELPYDTVLLAQGDPNLVEDLQAAGVNYEFKRPASPIGSLMISWILPLLLLGGFWYLTFRRVGSGGGMGGVFGVGRSKATEVKAEDVGVTFADVGGADEAINELQEIIQFLKTPQQFERLGGRIPKGVLLVGPPGTGKTLLAKASAGEAAVPFFETSGSEFVEMFVGVGAARVRDLFEQARKVAPAVIFIDEIDAIGQSRASAMRLGGNDEREQTLNQLLSEIDGFTTGTSGPVIIMAATNRPEVLDPALLRAGRFDRQITVGNPDLIGREQILRIHSRGIILAGDFDIARAARITPGFSGADLANVMNEAALLAARRQANAVTLADFQEAIERVVAGLEQRTRVMNERERTAVACHESGHALVAALVPNADPVSKISIIPRSRGALGYTMQMPTEDRYLLTTDELQDRIAVMLGGRAAEKVVYGQVSTGASDDIMRATELARRMVTEFGMSERLGSVRYAGQQMQYLGGSMVDNSNVSQETAKTIDAEIQRIISEQYERAQSLLKEHRGSLDTLTARLLEQETVDGCAVAEALGQECEADSQKTA